MAKTRKTPEAELEDVVVREVSAVPAGANGRVFAIVKKDGASAAVPLVSDGKGGLKKGDEPAVMPQDADDKGDLMVAPGAVDEAAKAAAEATKAETGACTECDCATCAACTCADCECADCVAARTAAAESAKATTAKAHLAVGNTVRVKPGSEHDPSHAGAVGTVAEIDGTSIGIKFEGTDEVHRWYTESELEVVEPAAAAPAADDVAKAGRVLSAANLTLIKDCVGAMEKAIKTIKDFLKAVDTPATTKKSADEPAPAAVVPAVVAAPDPALAAVAKQLETLVAATAQIQKAQTAQATAIVDLQGARGLSNVIPSAGERAPAVKTSAQPFPWPADIAATVQKK